MVGSWQLAVGSKITDRFMGSKVLRFGLVPFTLIPTDRLNKVLKLLKVLRSPACAFDRKFTLA